MMIETIWTYRVKPGKREEFERIYAANGDWARLFAKAPGYEGTSLLRDQREVGRYATVDRWESAEALDAFKKQLTREYEDLDQACEELTKSEEHVGVFEVA
jgi:heme-degrading monooxygenase HmoA